jgi:uncharacterized cupin superfamily protein
VTAEPNAVREATLQEVDSGLAPVTDGWFVVNVRDAAWLTNEAFGARCVFEGDRPVFRKRPDLAIQKFAELGLTLQVLEPGQPSSLYHAESAQEAFLVLVGECLLLVEGEERRLRAWDFVHCPAGTEHVFVGAGSEPCVIFMAGRRLPGRTVFYPDSEPARSHGAGAHSATSSPVEAYAPFPHWQPERPAFPSELPWVR